MTRNILIIVALCVICLAGAPDLHAAQADDVVCVQDVIVQVDDWLSKLSEKFYGDVFAYPAIAEATNTMATVDNTYATIEDVDLIEPGWKLCIVDVPVAEEIVGFELDNAPGAEETPSNLTGVINVGAAHALSGPLAVHGQAIRAGIELAVNEINSSNYLGEAQLNIIWQDTGGDSAQAKTAFNSLINTEQLVAILGPTLSRSAFVANPVAQAAGVPVIGSSNVVEEVTAIGNYIFRTSLPERTINSYAMQQIKSTFGLEQIIILYDDTNTFTRVSQKNFEQVLFAENVEILAQAAFSTGDPDFAAQLPELLGLEPDAIVLIALPEDAASIISQARSIGLSQNIRFIGSSSLNTPVFLNLGGDAVEGTLVGTAWHPAITSGANRQFVTRFEAEYGQLPNELAAQSYTAVRVLAAALREANSTEPAAIRAALAAVEFVESPLGLFSFDENRNPTYTPVLQIVRNGSFEPFQ